MTHDDESPGFESSVARIVRDLGAGKADAAAKLWERFFPRLLGLARKTLASVGGPFADAEDAVQSAFVAFWRKARKGDFADGCHGNRAWQLLATITVRKVLKRKERQGAQKRGGGRVVTEAALRLDLGHPPRLDEMVGQITAPELDLCCEEELLKLEEEPRAIVLLRMMGYANREIAKLLDCCERTIERKLNIVRLTWERENHD